LEGIRDEPVVLEVSHHTMAQERVVISKHALHLTYAIGDGVVEEPAPEELGLLRQYSDLVLQRLIAVQNFYYRMVDADNHLSLLVEKRELGSVHENSA